MVQNALTIYQKMPDPLAAIQALGRDIAGSKMFGDLTVAQGNVFAMECLSRGIPPLMLAEEYDVIYGKLSRKASASMSNFLKAGGTSKILSRTSDSASVKLTFGSDEQTFTLTWEAAQQETFPYEGKEKDIVKALAAWNGGKGRGKQPELKPKYATPHSRMQMLWSRLIKDAVKAITGDGVDAVGDPNLDDDATVTVVGSDGQDAVDVPFEVVEPKADKFASTNGNGQHAEKPIDYSLGKEPDTQPATGSSASDDKGDSCLCTPDQVASISTAMNELGMTSEKRGAALAKRGVNTIPALSHAQATEMLANLRSVIDARRKAAMDAANGKASQAETAATVSDVSGPATAVQVEAAKSLLKEIEQASPNYTSEFVKRYKSTGRDKLAEMTCQEIESLIESLKTKNLESFFAASLKPKVKQETQSEAAGEGSEKN